VLKGLVLHPVVCNGRIAVHISGVERRPRSRFSLNIPCCRPTLSVLRDRVEKELQFVSSIHRNARATGVYVDVLVDDELDLRPNDCASEMVVSLIDLFPRRFLWG
jgi:hypothetical protein